MQQIPWRCRDLYQENRNKYSEQHVLNAFTCFLGCGKLKQSYTVFYIDKTIDVYWESPADIPATFEINGSQHNRDDGAIVPILFEVVEDLADISIFDKIRIATDIINEIDSIYWHDIVDASQNDKFSLDALENIISQTEPIWWYLVDYTFKDNQPPNCGQGMIVVGDKFRTLSKLSDGVLSNIKKFFITNNRDITKINTICEILNKFKLWSEDLPEYDPIRRNLIRKEISFEPFVEFKNLQDGWTEGAKAIDHQLINNIYKLFDIHYQWDLARPKFYANPEGSIRAEWSLAGYELCLDFPPQVSEDSLVAYLEILDPNDQHNGTDDDWHVCNLTFKLSDPSPDWNWFLSKIKMLSKIDSTIWKINFLQKGISS